MLLAQMLAEKQVKVFAQSKKHRAAGRLQFVPLRWRLYRQRIVDSEARPLDPGELALTAPEVMGFSRRGRVVSA